MTNRNDLGKILKQRRLTIPMKVHELAAKSGVSASHIGRIERGERFSSAHVLRKITKPLNFDEGDLFTLAGFLSPQHSEEVKMPASGQLDPTLAALLSQEPVEIQRAVVAILNILKIMARASSYNIEFAEYVHRNYPELDEDIVTMVEDLIERQRQRRKERRCH